MKSQVSVFVFFYWLSQQRLIKVALLLNTLDVQRLTFNQYVRRDMNIKKRGFKPS